MTIKVDSDSEFIIKGMDKWAYERDIELFVSRLGKPRENAMMESLTSH